MRKRSFCNFDGSVIFNFTNQYLKYEAFIPKLEKSNISVLCVKIYSVCIKFTKSQLNSSLLMIPRPLPINIALEEETIKLWVRVLVLDDLQLLNESLEFVRNCYMDKFHYKEIVKYEWVVPLLIYKIEPETVEQIG